MKVFVDTSALFAVLDERDPNHVAAGATWHALLDEAGLVTHNYVHLEAEALVRRWLGRDAAAVLIDVLLPALTTVWVDEPMHRAAVEAWRVGGGTSLVDHVSFAVMRNAGMDVAFAFDADFERHGFRKAATTHEPTRGRLSEASATYAVSPSDETDLVGLPRSRRGRATRRARSSHGAGDTPAFRRIRHLASGPIWRWPSVESWIRAEPRRSGALRGKVPGRARRRLIRPRRRPIDDLATHFR